MKRLASLLLFVLAGPLAGQAPPFLTCCNGAGGGGVTGLTSCAAGHAIADNALLRGDGTTGCQGSAALLDDAGLLTLTGPLLVPFGTAGAGGVCFSGATNRCMFGANGGTFFSISGASKAGVSSAGDFLAGSSSMFCFAGTATPDTGTAQVCTRRVAASVAGFSDGGANVNGWYQWAGECFVAADQTNATTTLQTSTCSIAVTTGRKYTFKCELFMSDSVAAEGAKMDFAGGTATATDFRAQITAFDTALNLSSQVTALATVTSASTFTGAGAFEIHGSFEPSATGTFIPRFAQVSHAAGTLTLFRGSHCTMLDTP